MIRSDYPVSDAEQYISDREREAKRLPTCDWCGARISEGFVLPDGERICGDCMLGHYEFFEEEDLWEKN